jgi:hypothetical protein
MSALIENWNGRFIAALLQRMKKPAGDRRGAGDH